MTREDKLVERITYLTKIALGEEPNKDFSEAILQATIKAAKVGYSYAVDEACEWLEKKACLYVWNNCEQGEHGIHKTMLEDFRKAMKGGEK